MLTFASPVKFIGINTKSGTGKNGKPYSFDEAIIFVPDVGRVKVMLRGVPPERLPKDGSTIQLSLSVDQGSFQSLMAVWDHQSVFKPYQA